MAGFRTIFINTINKTACFIPVKLLQKASNQKIILPFYHTISDVDVPHIKHLYSVKNIKSFTKDLDFLLKYYKPIDYKQFQELTINHQIPKNPSFLLSFDDGLREFHDIIAPILKKKGIPAICFLNSAFIDNSDLFFRYKASLLVDIFFKSPKLAQENNIKSIFDNPQNITKSILDIKYKNKDILDKIANEINYSFNDYLSIQKPYLSSDQIFSLIKQGFNFGSHSIDHPEYQYLEYTKQIYQTKKSLDYIVNKFSLDNKIFSFPFTDYGVSKQFCKEINSNKIIDLTFGSAGQKKEEINNHFHRIPFEMAELTGNQILNAELLYYIIKAPLSKNKIKRK